MLNGSQILNISPEKNLSMEIKDIEDLKCNPKVSLGFYDWILSSSQMNFFYLKQKIQHFCKKTLYSFEQMFNKFN